MPEDRPAKGGTPGANTRGSKRGDTSPGASEVKGEDWATLGFLVENPPDEYANLTAPDSLENKPTQCKPAEHAKQSNEAQRKGIDPLKSEWV